MKIISTKISGCYEIFPIIHKDFRGVFVKTFHHPTFKKFGLNTIFKEEYYSTSYKNVIRGLHLQLPPHDHVKLIYCISGIVKDVVVDLRLGSPTYGKHLSINCRRTPIRGSGGDIGYDLSLSRSLQAYVATNLLHDKF